MKVILLSLCCFFTAFQAIAKGLDELPLEMTFSLKGISLQGKQTGLPAPTSRAAQNTPKTLGVLFSKGYGGEVSTSVFLNPYIAVQLSAGLDIWGLKPSAIEDVAYNYSNSPKVSNQKNIFVIPISCGLRFPIAPYGGIVPHIGIGGSYNYVATKPKALDIQPSPTLYLDLGSSLILDNNIVISINLRRQKSMSKINWKLNNMGEAASQKTVKSKISSDEWSILGGLGLRF